MSKYNGSIGIYDLVEGVISYLHEGHDYYMNNALVKIAEATENLIAPCPPNQKAAVWQFFSDYKKELEIHFQFEEGEVFPYVRNLLAGHRIYDFSISDFSDNHSDIDTKLSDFKRIIRTSLPPECDSKQKNALMKFLFDLQKDLERHTRLEDEILVPLVRMVEDPHFSELRVAPKKEPASDALSEREKEILVSVAQGMLNKEIADKHNISINTVITHRKNITRKTGIKTVAGLTVYAILNGLIDINTVE